MKDFNLAPPTGSNSSAPLSHGSDFLSSTEHTTDYDLSKSSLRGLFDPQITTPITNKKDSKIYSIKKLSSSQSLFEESINTLSKYGKLGSKNGKNNSFKQSWGNLFVDLKI